MGNRIQGILLVGVFMLCMISEASAGSYNDVRVSVTRDKANYSQEEVACLTVLVENMMDEPIYHVRIEEHLPYGLQLAEESGIFVIDEIPAKASAARSFYVMTRDGLSIVAKPDKAYYNKGETAELKVVVTNHLGRPVRNVRINAQIPDGLQLAEESGLFVIDEIPAKTSITRSFYVTERLDGLLVVAKADKAHYDKGETAELKVIVTNHLGRPVQNVKIEHLLPGGLQYVEHSGGYALEHSALGPGESVEYVVRMRVMDPLPKTGDPSNVQMLVCIAVMLTAALLTVKVRKRREAK